MRVVLAGGGTAGHVNPLLSTAAELRRRDPHSEITVLGTRTGLEARLVPQAGFELAFMPKASLPRRPSPDWFRLPGRWRAAVRAAESAIARIDADVVIGFGGYVSAPAYVAARHRHVPYVVHEANFRPGLANRMGARHASRVAVTFPDTAIPGATLTGLPIRPQIATLDRGPAARQRAAAELGLDPALTTLLVTGGSLGAQRLNETMTQVAPTLLDQGIQVLHLTGKGKSDELSAAVGALPGADRYHIREYLDGMELAFAVADLVVCRSGAGMVCELACVGLPAVYVPLPIGNGEQRFNAGHVVSVGGGLLVDNEDFTAQWARDHVVPLLANTEHVAAMASAARSVGIRDGAARLVDLAQQVARR